VDTEKIQHDHRSAERADNKRLPAAFELLGGQSGEAVRAFATATLLKMADKLKFQNCIFTKM